MGILDNGCGCKSCIESSKSQLKQARELWQSGERKILFESYHYTCGEPRCCDDYGTHVYVNGFQIITSDGENNKHVLENLMEFLEIEGVEIDYKFDNEEY